MSDFQSNYPRNSSIGRIVPDVPALQRIALSGLVWVIAGWVLFFASFVVGSIGRPPGGETIMGAVILVWAATFVGLSWCVAVWVYRAHKLLCDLRGIEPRMSSFAVAGLSIIPIVLFGLPLSYTMDFLVIRSESDTKPTMKWTSLLSKSGQVNGFALLQAIPGLCLLFGVMAKITGGAQALVGFAGILALHFSTLVGASMAFQTNRRIAMLIDSNTRRDFPNSPPPVRDVHLDPKSNG